MSRIASVLCFSALFLCLLRGSGAVSAEEGGRGNLAGELLTIEGEILEVDELKEPAGSAIYLVKNFATGETLKLFADAYRSVVGHLDRGTLGTRRAERIDLLGNRLHLRFSFLVARSRRTA